MIERFHPENERDLKFFYLDHSLDIISLSDQFDFDEIFMTNQNLKVVIAKNIEEAKLVFNQINFRFGPEN